MVMEEERGEEEVGFEGVVERVSVEFREEGGGEGGEVRGGRFREEGESQRTAGEPERSGLRHPISRRDCSHEPLRHSNLQGTRTGVR